MVCETLPRSQSTLALKSKKHCYKLNLVNLVKTLVKLQKGECQQAWQVVRVKSIISYFQAPLRPTCCWSTKGSNGVTGTVLVCGDPEQSARPLVAWLIINRKHTEEQTLLFFLFLLGIKSTYSTQYFKVKWAETCKKFVLLYNVKCSLWEYSLSPSHF